MGKDNKDFREELKKLAEIVEVVESSFLKNEKTEVKVSLKEDTFISLLTFLNYNTSDNKCIISIGDVEFTFLKM
jgi:hypothetical protein